MSFRSKSPEKYSPEIHYIMEGEDEEEKINEILLDENTNVGDIIEFMANNQLGNRKTKIIKNKEGFKIILQWKYTYDL
jgi:hypothetical protein